MDRPTSTDDRDMGRVRNRSITPVVRSVLRPTAVPTLDVVRLSVSSPAIAKSTYDPPGMFIAAPNT